MITALVSMLLCMGVLAGCSAPFSVAEVIPVSGLVGQPAALQVDEYALVEQSKDNPDHISFQDRVLAAVTARQTGWHFPRPDDLLHSPNQLLQAFGYRLAVNPAPPFSAYALYRGDNLVQGDIARFWPVSINQKAQTMDQNFLLPIETTRGERLVISSVGVGEWPGSPQSSTPPVYFGNEVAYADTSNGQLGVYAGEGMLFTGLPNNSARAFISWSDEAEADHWGLEIEHDILIDGQSINKTNHYQESFGLRLIHGQPLYFFVRDGLTRLHYAGKDLPFNYDQVVHDQNNDLTIFNPDGVDHLAWFYAMRDGLWYYVEVGFKE